MAGASVIPPDMQKWIDDNMHLSDTNFMRAFVNAGYHSAGMPIELLCAIDSYKCGRENSGPHRLPSYYSEHEYRVGAIHAHTNDAGDYFGCTITTMGMYTYDYEVIIPPAQFLWAMDTYYMTRGTDPRTLANFICHFGTPESHGGRGALDIILCGELYDAEISLYLTHEDMIYPYERELYPGKPGTVLKLPDNRGGTWYVVDPQRVGIFTCHVKHFPTRDAAEEEVLRIREEKELEAAADAHYEDRYWNEPVLSGSSNDERWLCGCDDPSQVVPACGGCICGCRRGCNVSRHHNSSCEFIDPGEED
jgi:hypothetical protein